ncbi:hypothetical protein EMIHUDRAFT_205975 [Emiliania huxleyi CCMP1516]|uniref:Glycolipid transfer protein domain-containing protein n=2 Tax=Emiliania huxleyi TaxID=2903 RepID=A0A0D3I4T5_EMIH1|nr:hypothetical protein EMIHUDRAFT_249952 [Emiliania huxleyi CCMP1516]XP_005778248.1 hypothetical protein EMIHUDRAFT_205975 [Emiliania huxleyi CCMP1516]EOD06270.1 hypothetical protein EMIHUDRAFT_249952 [Emiliania huxleyi CCMP1516]EOD25819.1 hypothetical protein EMIHUDRAFT_205975 [Emiliania huxleyi CCMP1516]|mmetsp:Transcript_2360/g.6825  ORF Transcript_2360/g.6825 Transcript_2360/m.6825 type:complete len:273 (-) Transcript_2360:64-882(-)|eukprot:XP_005758699.1 hypothetical protein EMIHUDRAFT_249952 [Emiliania huxleyi CCMP1516]
MAFPHLFATPELTAFGLATGVMLACMVGDMLMSTFYTLTWKGGTMDDGGGAGEFSSVVARVAFTWEGLIAGHARPGGFPVQSLLDAMAVQSASSRLLGPFMMLICKCDESNIRTIREAWLAHGSPASLRALLAAERAAGAQLGEGRLEESSAALALTWATRMLGFWLGILRALADEEVVAGMSMPRYATGVVYNDWVAPYHGLLLRSTFRAGLRALPARGEMLRRLAGGDTSSERQAHLVRDCKRCIAATERVIETLRAALREQGLRDETRV